MNTADLEGGKKYFYAACSEKLIVKYKRKTLNGYVFTNGIKENELSELSVINHIEEINETVRHEYVNQSQRLL